MGAPGVTSKHLISIIKSLNSSTTFDERERQKTEFERKFRESDYRLDKLVQEHSSSLIGIMDKFDTISSKIDESRARIKEVSASLYLCKQVLHCKRDELKLLWVDGVEQRTVVDFLERIESAKTVPALVEQHIIAKRYLHATELLVVALADLNGHLLGIDALKELRAEIMQKEKDFYTKIVDEIHYVIYEKFSENPVIVYKALESCLKGTTRDGPMLTFLAASTGSNVYKNGQGEDERKSAHASLLEEELNRNSSSNPSRYLAILVESLAILKRLPQALNVIRTKIQPHLLSIVQRATQDVLDDPTESSFGNPSAPAGDVIASVTTGNTNVAPVSGNLEKLLHLVTSRMRAVAAGHEILLSQLQRSSDDYMKDNPLLLYSITDVWSKIQTVIQSLLVTYLDLQGASAKVSLANERRFSLQKSEAFQDTEVNLNDFFVDRRTTVEKEPLFRFDASSHGLSSQAYLIDKKRQDLQGDNEKVMKKTELVCRSDINNVQSIFSLLVKFMSEVEEAVQCEPGTSVLQRFVSDFIQNTFLVQVRYNVQSTINIVTKGFEAFRTLVDQKTQQQLKVDRPVLHSAATVYRSVLELSRLMCLLPIYADDFLDLLCQILNDYKDTCRLQYKNIVHGESEEKIVSAAWVDDEDISKLLRSLPYWHALQTGESVDSLLESDSSVMNKVKVTNAGGHQARTDMAGWYDKEAQLLISNLTSEDYVSPSEMILDHSKFRTIASLQCSLEWFALRVSIFIEEWSNPTKSDSREKFQDTTNSSGNAHSFSLPSPAIPAKQLQKLRDRVSDFKEISESCLLLLRLEVCVHCCHFLLPVTRQLHYSFSSDNLDPDANVTALTRDLTVLEELIKTSLTQKKLRYVFEGLGHLMSCLFISGTQRLASVNEFGLKRISRNIFTLQQCLANITLLPEAELDRARQYFDMLYRSSDDIVKSVIEQGVTFSETEYIDALQLLHRSLLSQHESDKQFSRGKAEQEHQQRLERIRQVFRVYRV